MAKDIHTMDNEHMDHATPLSQVENMKSYSLGMNTTDGASLRALRQAMRCLMSLQFHFILLASSEWHLPSENEN